MVETFPENDSAAQPSALEQARNTIAQSNIASASSTTPTVIDALHNADTKTRVDARMATLEVLSALDKGVAQKRQSAELQQSVEDIMQRLMAETVQARRFKILRRLRIAGFAAFVVFLFWASHWRLAGNWWLWYVGGGAWAADQTMGKRRKTVSELRQAGDPRAVGVLAVAAHDGETAVRQAAHQALRELLPRVRADHAAAITPAQMTALLELAFRSEPAMQIATLQALEQIGDPRAIPVVENLSLSPHPQVRDQAKQCLPFLQTRARRAEQSATLLRGTTSPPQIAAPRELLRPVSQTVPATPPTELLRPILESGERDDPAKSDGA